MAYLADQILSFLQRRCEHPDRMVAVDILEGCGDHVIAYCRRCGAVRVSYKDRLTQDWRIPNPNLWRGK